MTVDVMVHLNDASDDAGIEHRARTLAGLSGVVTVRANPAHKRLMLVDYDPATTNGPRIIEQFAAHGHAARLIGL